MEAEIDGPQRKVMSASVRPLRSTVGTSGIPLRGGRSLPFVVSRSWSAPAGYYSEGWYLVDPHSREVLYEGPFTVRLIRGLQALTEVTSVVDEAVALDPGRYLVVFALGGLRGGELEVEAEPAEAPEAA